MDQWLPALFGLLGVALGVILASFYELWRRALDGKAAARVLRAETIANRTKVDALLEGKAIRAKPDSSAWRALRLQVAPFLDELRLMRVAQSYYELGDMGLHQPEGKHYFVLVPQDKRWVSEWYDRMQEQARWLRSVEAANPLKLIWQLLLGWRASSAEEVRLEYGVSEEEFERHKVRIEARSEPTEESSSQ